MSELTLGLGEWVPNFQYCSDVAEHTGGSHYYPSGDTNAQGQDPMKNIFDTPMIVRRLAMMPYCSGTGVEVSRITEGEGSLITYHYINLLAYKNSEKGKVPIFKDPLHDKYLSFNEKVHEKPGLMLAAPCLLKKGESVLAYLGSIGSEITPYFDSTDNSTTWSATLLCVGRDTGRPLNFDFSGTCVRGKYAKAFTNIYGEDLSILGICGEGLATSGLFGVFLTTSSAKWSSSERMLFLPTYYRTYTLNFSNFAQGGLVLLPGESLSFSVKFLCDGAGSFSSFMMESYVPRSIAK